jgi:hypothetical protein
MSIKYFIPRLSTLLLLPLLLLAAGCQSEEPQPQVTITSGSITIDSFQVIPGSHIAITGATDLPDRICLQTQFYENDQPVSWWPADDCIRVSGGTWQVNISLGKGDIPDELSQQASYAFEIWMQNTPSIKADPFSFDFSEPIKIE